MDLRLNEFQNLLATSAADFLSREVPFDRVRRIEDSGELDADLWKQIVQLGWTGLPIAEAYGGQGASVLDLGILLNEICRAATPSPFTATMVSALVVQEHGDEALKKDLLGKIVEGAIVTPAYFESSDSLDAPITTTYANGKVNGAKHFVEYGAQAAYYLVAATENGAPGLAVVRADQAGVSKEPLTSIGSTPMTVSTLSDATAEGWIDGQAALDTLRTIGAALSAYECYAYAQKALDMTVDYVQMRVQFGRPIGSFGPVQSRCADMATQVQASNFLAHELLYQIDQGSADPAHVAAVKAVTSRAVPYVCMEAHLLHGGMGFMREYNLQFYTRRGKEASLRWGTTRESLNQVADALLA